MTTTLDSNRLARVSLYGLTIALSLAVIFQWRPERGINPSLFQAIVFTLTAVWGLTLICRPCRVSLTRAPATTAPVRSITVPLMLPGNLSSGGC